VRQREQKDRAKEDSRRLRAHPAERRKAEVHDEGQQSADGGQRGKHPPQPAVKRDVPLPNAPDELQRTHREKQQPWNDVEQGDPRMPDVSSGERIDGRGNPSRVGQAHRGEDQKDDDGKYHHRPSGGSHASIPWSGPSVPVTERARASAAATLSRF